MHEDTLVTACAEMFPSDTGLNCLLRFEWHVLSLETPRRLSLHLGIFRSEAGSHAQVLMAFQMYRPRAYE